MIVNVPLTDFSSYPSPTSPELSETSSREAIPSVVFVFFTVNAPVCVAVVKIKSPSVALEMVSPFPKVRSPVMTASPVTVRLSPKVTSEVL